MEKSVQQWTHDDVVTWAKPIVGENHAEKLREEEIDGVALLTMTKEDFQKLMKMGPANNLYSALSALKGQPQTQVLQQPLDKINDFWGSYKDNTAFFQEFVRIHSHPNVDMFALIAKLVLLFNGNERNHLSYDSTLLIRELLLHFRVPLSTFFRSSCNPFLKKELYKISKAVGFAIYYDYYGSIVPEENLCDGGEETIKKCYHFKHAEDWNDAVKRQTLTYFSNKTQCNGVWVSLKETDKSDYGIKGIVLPLAHLESPYSIEYYFSIKYKNECNHIYYVKPIKHTTNNKVRVKLYTYKNTENNKNAYDRYSLFIDESFLEQHDLGEYEVIYRPHEMCVKEKREDQYYCDEGCCSQKELEEKVKEKYKKC